MRLCPYRCQQGCVAEAFWRQLLPIAIPGNHDGKSGAERRPSAMKTMPSKEPVIRTIPDLFRIDLIPFSYKNRQSLLYFLSRGL